VVEQNKEGQACDNATDCLPGDGACPPTTTATTTTTKISTTTVTTTTIYDPGNVDCVEEEDECTAACQTGSNRNYAVRTLAVKKGKVCTGPTDCLPGEGACPTSTTATTTTTTTISDPGNVDCVEEEDECTAACQGGADRNYAVRALAVKFGKACTGPTDCQPGDGACSIAEIPVADAESSTNKEGMSTGIIAAIVVGVLALVGLSVAAVLKSKRTAHDQAQALPKVRQHLHHFAVCLFACAL